MVSGTYHLPFQLTSVLKEYFQSHEYWENIPYCSIHHYEHLGKVNVSLLTEHKIRLLIPMRTGNDVYAIVLLQDKTNGEFYTFPEIMLLVVIFQSLAMIHKHSILQKQYMEQQHDRLRQKGIALYLHDIKNIKVSLDYCLQHLSNSPLSASILPKLQQIIHKTANRLFRMERTLSSLESNEETITCIFPNSIIQQLLNEWNTMNITFDCTNPQIQLLFERDQFIQVVFNLLSNAVEATQPNHGMICVTTWEEDTWFYIQVKDSGIGIDSDFQNNHLYKPFCTTKPEGLGLGLFNVKEILTAHDGSIAIKSQKNQGTTVTIAIPIRHHSY
jgi:signal transduction histidine kinase